MTKLPFHTTSLALLSALAGLLLLVSGVESAFLGTASRVAAFHKASAITQCFSESPQQGTYRPFAEYAWSVLEKTGWLENAKVDLELSRNEAPAKGFPEGSTVRIEAQAKVASSKDDKITKSPLRYARYALLETLVPNGQKNSTQGIQVLNLVFFPSEHTSLPVWGIDLVSLPGDKHLLLLDAQPMTTSEQPWKDHWSEWHDTHVTEDLPWGGDIPEQVAKYVSKYALWTRLQGSEVVELIQTQVWDAFREHLDLYLDLLCSEAGTGENDQTNYVQYRIQNDPARPMLRALYGEEWTERLLSEVLFP